MSKARAELEITASDSKLAAGLRSAATRVQSWAAATARGVGHAFDRSMKGLGAGLSKLNSKGGGALSHFAGNLLTKGFDHLVDAAHDVQAFERNLVRMQIAAGKTPEEIAAIGDQMRQISKATGIASDDIQAGAAQYIALTGDMEGATAAMETFARVAQASGSSVDDVAQATAALKTSMGLDSKDIEAAFSAMIVQGKGGAVELKDLAAQLAELAPQFAQFRNSKGVGGIRELGAAFQVVRTGAGSAGAAATQLRAMMSSLADPRTIQQLKALKIDVFSKDPKTGVVTMRSASDIIEDLARNQKLLDPRVMSKVFGREEARAAVRSLQQHIGLYRDLRAAAEDTGAVQRDLTTFLTSGAGRVDLAMNRLKETIAEVFTPERIQAFVEVIEEVADAIGRTIDGLGEIKDYVTGKSMITQNPFDIQDEEVEGPGILSYAAALGGGSGILATDRTIKKNTMGLTNAYLANEPGKIGERARIRAASRTGYDEELAKIESGGSRKERIRRAVRAAMYVGVDTTRSPEEMGLAGDLGRSTAGERYLNKEGVTSAEKERIYEEMIAETIRKELPKITQAIREGMKGAPAPTVKLGDNQVASSVKGAKNANSGVW